MTWGKRKELLKKAWGYVVCAIVGHDVDDGLDEGWQSCYWCNRCGADFGRELPTEGGR